MADVSSNLVAGYHMEESSGTAAADFSGNGYNGVWVSTPTWQVSGKYGKSATALVGNGFYGDGWSAISCPYTVTAWLGSTNVADEVVVFASGDTPVRATWNNLHLTVFNGNGSQAAASPSHAGALHLFCLVDDGTTQKMYVDGTEVTSQDSDEGQFLDYTNGGGAIISSIGTSSNVTIDDPRVYDRALSAADVAYLYALTKPTITSSSSVSIEDGATSGTKIITVTSTPQPQANLSPGDQIYVSGGADAALEGTLFNLDEDGSSLGTIGKIVTNGSMYVADPQDSDSNNTYVLQLKARVGWIDGDPQTLTVTVTAAASAAPPNSFINTGLSLSPGL